MMNIKENSKNKDAYKKISHLSVDIKRGIRESFYNIGKKLILDAKKACLKQPKHGRTYLIRLGKSSRRHVASAAGEAPATITRNLLRAHDIEIQGTSRMLFGINDRVPYGRALELGYAPRKLAPRLWLKTTIDENEKNIEKIFGKNIKEELIKK